MTTHFRARYDGKVFVPIDPVNVPLDEELELSLEAPPSRPLALLGEALDRLNATLPPSQLPADAAAQHDHYLYGTPKRSAP